MAKPATIKIRLNSTAGTGFFYVTKKNPRNMTEKMVKRKYDPIAKKHVEMAMDGLGLMGHASHTDDETADIRTLATQTKRAVLLMYRLLNR